MEQQQPRSYAGALRGARTFPRRGHQAGHGTTTPQVGNLPGQDTGQAERGVSPKGLAESMTAPASSWARKVALVSVNWPRPTRSQWTEYRREWSFFVGRMFMHAKLAPSSPGFLSRDADGIGAAHDEPDNGYLSYRYRCDVENVCAESFRLSLEGATTSV